jgi:hypothetical protein
MQVTSSSFVRLVVCAAAMIGLAAAQAVLASPADALPGLQRPAKTTVSDSSTSKSVAARCPAGQNVIGGGGSVIGGRGQVVLERLQPVQTATERRFVVAAREDQTGYSRNWQLTAYAVCSNLLSGFGILDSTSGDVSSNSPQSTISFCIGQTRVGLGGRVNSGAGQVHLTNLTPASNGQVDFTSIAAVEDATGFAGAWNVTAYAVCASTPPNLVTVSAASPASSVSKSATVSCTTGTRVHSAGAQLTSAGSDPISGSLVIDGVAIDPELRSVTATAREDETGTNDDWSVRAVALCAP